jgi:hypothetical protein
LIFARLVVTRMYTPILHSPACQKEMFYTFAKPLKIHRPRIAMPYRSAEEIVYDLNYDE